MNGLYGNTVHPTHRENNYDFGMLRFYSVKSVYQTNEVIEKILANNLHEAIWEFEHHHINHKRPAVEGLSCTTN